MVVRRRHYSSDKGDWSAEQKQERIPRRMTASSRWRYSALVKLYHALAAWFRTDRSGGCWLEWRYALLVVQTSDDDDCIGSSLHLENSHACCQKFVKFSLLLARVLESSNFIHGPLHFIDQLRCTLVKKTWPLSAKSAMPKSTHFTYLQNIDIDIVIFCIYRIDIVSKFQKWYRSSTKHH